jgi:Methyltransferase FkbM domain
VRNSLNGHQRPLYKSTIALDDFVESLSIRPDFIKLDVEGAELQVFRGMQGTLVTSRPDIWVEFHAWPEMTLQQGMTEALVLWNNVDYDVLDPLSGRRLVKADDFASGNTAPYGRAYGLLKPRPVVRS